MDKVKMAEGRRRAAEQRRTEEEQARQEEERRKEQRRKERAEREVDPATVRDFEQLEVQLNTFYDELSILSKKTPDGSMNKFKLKFLNDTLKKVNALLGAKHRPFPDFELFNDADLPSTSDAVLMLSHYLKSMEQFRDDHTNKGGAWCVKGSEAADEDEDEDYDEDE